jgi:hypothetical protein
MNKIHAGVCTLMAAVVAVGCETSTSPEAELGDLNMDVAIMSQEATLEDIQSMAITNWNVQGVGTAAQRLAPMAFLNGAGSAMGDALTRSRTVTFFDADGSEMDAFEGGVTESIHFLIAVDGTIDRANWSATIDRDRALTVSGLSDDDNLREWNGEGSSVTGKTRYSDENGDRVRDMESESTMAGVVVATPRSENPYPLSGTITRHVTVAITNGPNGDVTKEKNVVVTFDGDNTALMTVDGEVFEIDLDDRSGKRPRRRP